MPAFRLTDTELRRLAAGRPTPGTLATLRKAQLSRHLLLLGEIVKTGKPRWYASTPSRPILADPATGLYAATAVAMMRDGVSPPPRPHLVDPAAHTLTATCDGHTIEVRLDAAGPLRDRLGLPPAPRLSPRERAHWQHLLAETWRLLVRHHPTDAALLPQVLRMIVPVRPDPSAGGISATSAHAYGAVAMSTPADPVSFAVGLLHETAHSLLNATLLLFDLLKPPPDALHYSPWRDDPRPPIGVLHGAYAYLHVTRFRQAEALRTGSALAAFEFSRWREAVLAATDTLLAPPPVDPADGTGPALLTAAGWRFVAALREEVDGWRHDVSADVRRLAADANVDHRVRWRLRNLRVDGAAVETLVRAWRSGGTAPELPTATIVSGPRRLEVSGRLDLVHGMLRDGAHRDPAGSAAAGLRPGDVAWLHGEAGTGHDAYRKSLERSGSAAEADVDADLAGLALVSGHRALRERPEVVKAVWMAAGRPSLDALLAWIPA